MTFHSFLQMAVDEYVLAFVLVQREMEFTLF